MKPFLISGYLYNVDIYHPVSSLFQFFHSTDKWSVQGITSKLLLAKQYWFSENPTLNNYLGQ